MTLTVTDDMFVSLEYSLWLDDGEIIDSSEEHGPLEFVQGRGTIMPGLERQLYGMTLGESRNVVLSPAEGYGEYDPEAFQTVPRSVFPPDLELEVGMGFQVRTPLGRSAVVFIDEVDEDKVVLDLNHPLAGRTLHFNVKVVGLREATPEELASSD